MTCTVCHTEDINPLATKCPSCEAELLAFTLLEDVDERSKNLAKEKLELEGKLVHAEKERLEASEKLGKSNFKLGCMSTLFFLVFFPLFLPFCSGDKKIEAKYTLQDNADSLAYLNEKIADLEQRPRTIYYVIRERDKLETIAKLFYNDAQKWPIIKADNNIPDEFMLVPGDTILIKY